MNPAGFEQLKAAVERRGQPFNVLIVDDERYVREVFRDYCAITKVVAVDMATDGKTALERVCHETYDLITLDLIMPEMSGIDALIAIKDVCPHVPIMIVTGNATDKLIDEAGVLGACKVMYKPVLLDEFVDTLANTLIDHDTKKTDNRKGNA
ncbi:hypothetical protein C3F09_11175 [candidate division GN15 bacterium]|uniref:Response regulatory domain-containing protein n=1 Tax=candidate division GN15 bacterium TaxID=2072418 RepID=A0A855X3J9_9BACT|nr:MAG: hypothetical protein C3F09_11175 [candidate division GN15 bacterium]